MNRKPVERAQYRCDIVSVFHPSQEASSSILDELQAFNRQIGLSPHTGNCSNQDGMLWRHGSTAIGLFVGDRPLPWLWVLVEKSYTWQLRKFACWNFALSKWTPRLFTVEWILGARGPRVPTSFSSDCPNTITSVLFSFNLRKFEFIHDLMLFKPWSRSCNEVLVLGFRGKYIWMLSTKQCKETPCFSKIDGQHI